MVGRDASRSTLKTPPVRLWPVSLTAIAVAPSIVSTSSYLDFIEQQGFWFAIGRAGSGKPEAQRTDG